MKQHFEITGMTCVACSSRIQQSVEKVSGVSKVDVNLLTRDMTVEGEFELAEIVATVVKIGYGANASEGVVGGQATDKANKTDRIRIIVSFVFLIPLFIVSMGSMIGIPMNILTDRPILYACVLLVLTLPIVAVNFFYFTTGFKALLKRSPNMNTLVALGSAAAFLYGLFALCMIIYGTVKGQTETVHSYMHSLYFESAGMILSLITLGKFLESRSKKRTISAIEKLVKLSPDTATVLMNGTETEVKSEDVRVDDIVVLKTGERAAIDGIVTEGSAAADTSAVTGESMYAELKKGDRIVSGSVIAGGYIQYRATAVGEDTTIKKIVRLVEEASSSKAPISRLADKISGIFVPVVMSISLISFIVWLAVGYGFAFSLSAAISVLVISCPCALGLATPVAVMVGTGKGAEQGLLIKNAESLELLHKIDCVVFDKTGTITEGRPHVSDFETDLPCEEFFKLVYNLERLSIHPIADGIVRYSEEYGADFAEVTDFSEIAGKGLSGKIGGETIFAGSAGYMKSLGIATNAPRAGATAVYVGKGNRLAGVVYLEDQVKKDAKEGIAAIKKRGIRTVMLTGDNDAAARKIFDEIGLDEYRAEVLPQDKEAFIREYRDKGYRVAMVGDGINDAPALTRADVGIAIGAGTDIAVDSADVVLTGNSLLSVDRAIGLSKQTLRVIKQNLFWAFGYNILGIPIAAGVFYPLFHWLLNPMLAAAAMSLSSVSVVLNALRLRYYGKKDLQKEDKGMEKTIKIEGMSCEHCAKRVIDALKQVDGVTLCEVNLRKKRATVQLSDEVCDDNLLKAVEDAGYTPVGIK